MAKRKRGSHSSGKSSRRVRSRSSNPGKKSIINSYTGRARYSKTVPGMRFSKKYVKRAGKPGDDEQHSAIGKRYLKLVINSKPLKGKSLGTFHYSQEFRGLLGDKVSIYTSNGPRLAGTQAVQGDVFQVNTVSQFLNSTGSGYVSDQAFYDLFSMNYSDTTTGSDRFSAITHPANDRIGLKTAVINMQMTNFSTAACTVDCYFLQAKTDQTKAPDATWAAGLVSERLGSSDIPNPLAANIARFDTGGNMTVNVLNSQPYTVPEFNRFWKTLAKRTIQFSGGATEKLDVDLIFNTVFQKEVIQELRDQNIRFMKKTSIVMMCVTRGQCINDKTGLQGADINFVTTAPVEVGVVGTVRWNMCGVKGALNRLTISQGAQNITAPILGNTEMITNDDIENNVIVLK